MGSTRKHKRRGAKASGSRDGRSATEPARGPARGSRTLALGALGIAVVVAGILLVVRFRATAAPERPPEDVRSGTASMVARLKAIAEHDDVQSDIFANEARARLLERRLEGERDPTRRLQLLGQLGYERLLAGRTEEALAAFERSLQGFREIGLDPTNEAVVQVREFHAIASLRLGEQQNCIAAHGPDSCLLPLAGGGIHQHPEGAREAVREYSALLEQFPGDVSYRWLLNIAAMAGGMYPDGVPEAWRIPPETFASQEPMPRFPNVARALGLSTMSLAGGVVVEDLDGDGFLDVVASSWGLEDPLRFYRSNGDGTFSDRTEEAGLTGITGGLNLVHADYDNDGDADILVLRGAWRRSCGHIPNSLLRNDGSGRFTDVTESAGLLSFHPTQTAAWADFDDDGWLDLFVGNESTPGEIHPCELYRNDGRGGFEDVAPRVGLDHVGFVKGVACGDYDDDGLVDVYLSRFGQPNLLFHNDGGPAGAGMAGWRFSEVSESAGVREPKMSFPTWFFDYDDDGDLDLFAAPLIGYYESSLRTVAGFRLGGPPGEERMHLYRNDGEGRFTDVSGEVGLDQPVLAMGASFGDIDNDGFPDVYLGTGDPNVSTLVPNRMFRNHAGRRFVSVTTAGGFGHLQKGHGIAFADVDNDGDQDVYAVLGGAFSGDVSPNALFENPGNENAWITLVLEGTRCNRSAIGARIQVDVEGPGGSRSVHATVGTGGSFGSSSLQQEIGLGDATRVARVSVRWPGDREPQVWKDVPIRRFVGLKQGEPGFVELPRTRLVLASE